MKTDEESIAKLSPPVLRFAEARYYYRRYLESCGPPMDSYFEMVAHLDAFLFCATSVEELTTPKRREQLRQSADFCLLKAMRNVTCHHMVIGAAARGSRYRRPFRRNVNVQLGARPESGSAELQVEVAALRRIFTMILRRRPGEKNTIRNARLALVKLNANATLNALDFMDRGIQAIAGVLRVK